MRPIVIAAVALGLLAPSGCGGGCGCGESHQDQVVTPIPSRKRDRKRQARKLERVKRPQRTRKDLSSDPDQGIYSVGQMTASPEKLTERLGKGPLTPGAALVLAGAPGATEAERSQPHLQGLKEGTREVVITMTKVQSLMPPPKEPTAEQEAAYNQDEAEVVKAIKRRRRHRKK